MRIYARVNRGLLLNFADARLERRHSPAPEGNGVRVSTLDPDRCNLGFPHSVIDQALQTRTCSFTRRKSEHARPFTEGLELLGRLTNPDGD